MGLCASTESPEDRHAKVAGFLKSSVFFLHMSPKEIADFAPQWTIQYCKREETVVKQGSAFDRLYVVGSGAMVLHLGEKLPVMQEDEEWSTSSLRAGKDALTTKHKGSFIGQLEVLKDDSVAQFSVSAIDNSCLIWIDRDKLERYMESYNGVRDKIFNALGQDVENKLKTMPLFASVADKNVHLLASLLKYVSLEADQTLFREGDVDKDGNSLYIVYSGSLKAVTEDEDSKEVVLNTFQQGQFFGEIGLMIDIPRTATIKAEQRCLLLELAKADFRAFLRLMDDKNLEENVTQLMLKRTAESFRKYQVPLFRAIPDDKYPLLAQLAEIEEADEDVVIFNEGDPGGKFYLIVHGEIEVSITKTSKGKKKKIVLQELGPGNFFGETALMKDDNTRSASVVTKTRAVLVSLDHDSFTAFFQEVPEAMADFEVRLNKYNIAFESLLLHPLGLSYFRKHLEKEWATENISFWEATKQYEQKYMQLLPDDQQSLKRNKSFVHDIQEEEEVETRFMAEASRDSLVVKNDRELQEAMKVDALEIIKTYIDDNAPDQVNIKSDQRNAILGEMKNDMLNPLTFSGAQKEIFSLMQNDSFSRFKESVLFQEFLDAHDADTRNPSKSIAAK